MYHFEGNFTERKPSLIEPCSFCWFVLSTYPTLKGMSENDKTKFRIHLELEHGLKPEIPV